MKFIVLILLNLFLTISLISQDIVTSVDVVFSSAVDLGEEITVSLDIDYVRSEDSYDIDVDVNYSFNTINIKLDYDLDEDYELTSDSETEDIDIQLLLEGDYEIVVEVDVPFHFDYDQKISGVYVNVSNPENDHCDESFIPFLSIICPSIDHPVCACNGQNYDNECEAYLEDENGRYFEFICGNFVKNNSVPFECGKTYTIDLDNVFEQYECSFDVNPGEELYLSYYHEGDTLEINFESGAFTNVYLVELESNNLDCISNSHDYKLKVNHLSKGYYYIIADISYEWSNFHEITFCTPNSIDTYEPQNKIDIIPNPSTNYFTLNTFENLLVDIEVFDRNGKNVFRRNDVATNTSIYYKIPSGLYFVKLINEKESIIKKLVVE